MEKRTSFIVNPIAGGKTLKGFEIQVRQNFDGARILHSEFPGHSELLSRQAVEDGAELVVAVGGDGTVNEVGRGLLGSDVVMAIVPTGSGNGLARELNIPINKNKALDQLKRMKEKTIDSGKVNGHPFFCASGVGFDAQVSRLFQENHSTRGFSKYIKLSVQEYFNSKEDPYEIALDEKQSLSSKAWFITVANTRQFGNNAYICPLAKMDDGILDFAMVPKFNLLNIALPAVQLFSKQIHKNKNVRSGKARKIRIRQEGEWVHLDGEPKKLGKDLVFEVEKKSLTVLYNPN